MDLCCRQARFCEFKYDVAAYRVRIAYLALVSACIKAGFREDQSRDARGRWDGGNGGTIATRIEKTGNPKIDAKTEILVDVVKEVVGKIGYGSGSAYGVEVHAMSASTIRALDLPGIGRHGVEQSFSGGDIVRYGLDGSVRTDVILRDGRTASAPIMAVWDIKTGDARLTPARADEIRQGLGIASDVPVIEIHVRRGINVRSENLY